VTVHFDWSTLALQTINFAILVWLLHRFLYRPVLRLIDTRRAEIDKTYADARSAEHNAAAELAAISVERAGIAGERATARAQAVAEAEQSAAARLARAEREATALLDSARTAIAAERRQALTEARLAAIDLASGMVRKLVAEMPVKEGTDTSLARAEKHLSALPAAERDAFARQLVNGAGLKVKTASPLTAETAKAWRGRFQRILGDAATISFEVDERLIVGAELRFPDAMLRFSWRSALETMRAEVGNGDAH
jgi:F-type H+-transporting ATPase subunit b